MKLIMDWIKTLSTIAPALATAMGGPLAGAATKYIASNLLGDESASIDDIQAAVIGASPEQLAQIKSIDSDFKIKMESLGVDVFKVVVSDKKDARQQHRHSVIPSILVISLTLFVAAIVFMLFYTEPPGGAREILFMLLGIVVKEWSNALHYWHGTTRSSSEKTFSMK